ncbi:MAG: flavodoxin family protein [Clostridium sp.]|jgi:multimeric flavodoxin WrbA|nr:flavodoxin family protein [Clostridium sp.]
MKVLGIVGSKRKNGNTAHLVNKAMESVVGKEITTETIYLGDYDIKGCTGCEGCKKTYTCVIKDDMMNLYPKILEADAVIIGSPTYFYNISSDMKSFIDRLYAHQIFDDNDRSVWTSINEVLGGKYAVVIAICEQNNSKDMGFTAEAMSMPLEALGYRVVETVKVLHAFKKDDTKNNERIEDDAIKAGIKLKKTLLLKEKTKKNLRKV